MGERDTKETQESAAEHATKAENRSGTNARQKQLIECALSMELSHDVERCKNA